MHPGTQPLKFETRTFLNGVHPEEYKEYSAHKPIERLQFVDEYVIPLSQHIGAPAQASVKKGERVRRGQMIATPGGFVSVNHHSPVSGTVTGIEKRAHASGQMLPAIVIKADPYSSQRFEDSKEIDWKNMEDREFIKLVQKAGIVGLGGAAFPAHVKFSIPEGKKCRFIILNGCECEPFLTADHRVMLEHPGKILNGAAILLKFLKAEKCFIGIEANKSDAIEIFNNELKNINLPIEVIPLEVKYPQGAEKMLITAILKREVPSGKLPLDVESVVSNVGTALALSDYFAMSQPLIERVVSITGPGIPRPANLMIPIGTPIKHAINFCGGLKPETTRLLLGGPMMGMVQKSLDVPVTKGTSGILALTENEVKNLKTYNCIRCARCLDGCPAFLNPSRLGLLARKKLYLEMESANLMDCMECASCSFGCPSSIPLVQNFRIAKAMLRELKANQ
ncbi:electron transport complex subunit RsxC [Candidatus Riflebacteria bacterium]